MQSTSRARRSPQRSAPRTNREPPCFPLRRPLTNLFCPWSAAPRAPNGVVADSEVHVFNNSYRQKLLEKTLGRSTPATPRPASPTVRVRANPTSRAGADSPTADLAFSLLRVRDTPTPTSSRPQTPAAAPYTLRLKGAISRGSDDSEEEEQTRAHGGLGGLDDDDIAATRASIAGRKRGRPAQVCSCACPSNFTFIIIYCTFLQTQQLELFDVEPEPPTKPKGSKRRTHDEVPPSQSLSYLNLPAPIQAVYESKILPTCIHIYGGLKDPFTMSAKDLKLKYPKGAPTPALAEILTLLLHQLVEDTQDEVVEETDLLYRVVCAIHVLLLPH